MVKHKKAESFKISKLKNLLEKPWNHSEITRISDPSKSPAPRHHSFKLDLKLKYLNSDQSIWRFDPCQNVANWATPNLLQQMLNKSHLD